MLSERHDLDDCFDPTCGACLTHSREESVIALEVALLNAELRYPEGAWVDSAVTVSALDLRNVLDLVRVN